MLIKQAREKISKVDPNSTEQISQILKHMQEKNNPYINDLLNQ